MPLTDLVKVIPAEVAEEDELDIFAFAAGLIFPDDLRNMHGDSGSIIVYKSARFGNIELRVADVVEEDARKRFPQYLWNASLKMSELISSPPDSRWDVENQRVLELGAGTGLAGIVAALAGSRESIISDYPSDEVLDNIRKNTTHALPADTATRARVQGYAWGDADSDFARDNAHSFQRIMAADCFWMPVQHAHLVKSMLHMLSLSPEARVLAIAGFHTGRANLAAFFDEAVAQGLEMEDIYEEDADGVRREWLPERDGGFENHTERKRWLVIAVLKRGQQTATK
ncbi:putative lysine methyltransferase, S-adenosyl-L-methionine-dependent methyltransferase [Septoria linicola]|nr:putative lysine methyltransferase, S-adenosyl-L-methionine-dependent methyltransferase [Septoria linicola]